jgi:hypothetical protein
MVLTLKNFTRNLRRGLGSAIIELKTTSTIEKYRDIVMRACLNDIAHDTQVEGTKGFYLYTAIKTFDNQNGFLSRISEKFSKRLYWRLSEQLHDILYNFSKDEYKIAHEALENKYADLINRLPKIQKYSLYYCEREQLESLMISKLDSGIEVFKQCIIDMGKMIEQHGSDDCIWYDLFLSYAEDKFGKEIYEFIKCSENKYIAIFAQSYIKSNAHESDKLNSKIVDIKDFSQVFRYEQDNRKENPITIEYLVEYAKKLASEKNSIPLRINSIARKFALQTSSETHKTLANIILNEPSEFVKIALLRTFSYADFPLDIDLLLPYVYSDNEYMRGVAVKSLSRFNDARIHALILELFKNKQVESALVLLETNFKPEYEILLEKHIKSSKKVTHGMTISIVKIYENNSSKNCGNILSHFYENTQCTHCRSYIVEAMIKNNVIPDNIREECYYDSFEETRKLIRESLT